MFTTILFIFILSALIIVHEYGHLICAQKLGVRVEKFSLGFGPVLFKKKRKDTEYSIAAVPLGGFVKLAGDILEEYKGTPDEYFSQAPGRRFWIVFFGPLLNYILGFLCFWLIFFRGYPSLKVGGLLEGFGAQEAKIQVGDEITAVDGRRIYLWEELQNIIYAKKSSEVVKLSILREHKKHTVEVKIKEKELEGQPDQKIGLIGVTPQTKQGFFSSFFLSLHKTQGITLMTYKALWRMATGKLSMREMTGPVGIFYLTSKAARVGKKAILNLIGLISISLAIFNLLPLPLLDGGHILLLAIEKLRRRRLSARSEQVISQIGLTLIVTLALLVTYNDIVRFFGDKISKIFKL